MNSEKQTMAIQDELRLLADPETARHFERFFKTGKGQYGQGDQFLGVRVPVLRTVAKSYSRMPVSEILRVLHSPYHEERLMAVIMLVYRFEKADEQEQTTLYQVYLANTRFINSWDLVDCSAHKIVGRYLLDKDRSQLMSLSTSSSLWDRRIAIIATLYFIKHDQFDDTLQICERLLHDQQDLIHKATGWMLREVGNRNRPVEEHFLRQHCRVMPRTMLRYAIEKFSAEDRRRYMEGDVQSR